MIKKITKIKVIQQFLYDYGRRLYLREIATLLGKPHQSIKPYVEDLVKLGILVKTERKNLSECQINFKDKRAYDFIVIAEKEKIMEKLIEEPYLKVLYEKLSVFFEECTFVVFGSAVDNIQKSSDIDLLVIDTERRGFVLAPSSLMFSVPSENDVALAGTFSHSGISTNSKNVRFGARSPVRMPPSKIANLPFGVMKVLPTRSATSKFPAS